MTTVGVAQRSRPEGSSVTVPKPLAILFRINGTQVISGGIDTTSWTMAVNELFGFPADIGQCIGNDMTDINVRRETFVAVLNRQSSPFETAQLLERRLRYLCQTIRDNDYYRVFGDVEEMLPRFLDDGYLLVIVAGDFESAAHSKLHRAKLNRFFFGDYEFDSTERGEFTGIALSRVALVYGQSVSPDQCLVGYVPYDANEAHAAHSECGVAIRNNSGVDQSKVRRADFANGSLGVGVAL